MRARGGATLRWTARHRLILILCVTVALGGILVPEFLTESTFSLALDRASAVGIIAVGLTALMIAGQIDLSSGSVLALSSIATIGLQEELGPDLAIVAGILVGVAVGLINGFLVVICRVNSLVATLATFLAIRSVAHLITSSKPISASDPLYGIEITGELLGPLTTKVVVFLALVLLLQFFLVFTAPGRNLFAVGSNPVASVEHGINADRYLMVAFVFAGGCAGIAGTLQGLSVGTGDAVFGANIIIPVVAAVVIGGTRLEGGRGSALGTLGGVLTLAALTTAMEYQSVPAYIQEIVTGSILLLLVLADQFVEASRGRGLLLRAADRIVDVWRARGSPQQT